MQKLPEVTCIPEYQPKRIASRQETYDAILNNFKLPDAKVWRDSIVTYSPLGDPKRQILTLKIIEQLKELKAQARDTVSPVELEPMRKLAKVKSVKQFMRPTAASARNAPTIQSPVKRAELAQLL